MAKMAYTRFDEGWSTAVTKWMAARIDGVEPPRFFRADEPADDFTRGFNEGLRCQSRLERIQKGKYGE